MKKSPVAVVKDKFQSKDKLVEAVQKLATSDLWLDRVNGEKGLAKVSNQKLLKLHTVLTDAQKRFGSRDKLISAILELNKRTKDAGYTARIKKFPLPQLLDLHAASERASKKVAATAKAKAAPKAAKAEKKPAAVKKAPAAKKTATKK
jgi:hypothetical protein